MAVLVRQLDIDHWIEYQTNEFSDFFFLVEYYILITNELVRFHLKNKISISCYTYTKKIILYNYII